MKSPRLVLIIVALLAVLFGGSADAQTNVTPGRTLAFDQPAVSVDEANSFEYRAYFDGSASPVSLSPVVCSAAVAGSPVGTFPCEVPFPASTPGAHTMVATATNIGGESLPSTPFDFFFVVLPNPPRNLRLR